jgi:hypothetical protein
MHRIESSRRSLLAKIHILKKETGMSELEYRTCLEEWTGKASCSDMSDAELEEVRRRLGLLPRAAAAEAPAGTSPKKRLGSDDYPPGCSRGQWRKIKWLQRKLRWNDQNLRGYIKHVTKLEHENFLDVASARAVIAGLVQVEKSGSKEGGSGKSKGGSWK